MLKSLWKSAVLSIFLLPIAIHAQGQGCPSGASKPWPECQLGTAVDAVTGNLQLKSFITFILPADGKKYLVFECVTLSNLTEFRDGDYSVFWLPAENTELYSSIMAAYLDKSVVSVGYKRASALGRPVMVVKSFKLFP